MPVYISYLTHYCSPSCMLHNLSRANNSHALSLREITSVFLLMPIPPQVTLITPISTHPNVIYYSLRLQSGFPAHPDGKASTCNAEDGGLIPGRGDPRRRKWQPTPVSLPGELSGQRSTWGRKELDMTEGLSTAQHKAVVQRRLNYKRLKAHSFQYEYLFCDTDSFLPCSFRACITSHIGKELLSG